jgi:hypothetical protein
MTIALTPEEEQRAARPHLAAAQGPIRSAGGLFRAATPGGATPLGVPQASAEESVIAAVRMAYRVADAQMQRSARLADRLRKAGDSAAGEPSERKAVEALERLTVRSLTDALGRLETLAMEPENPLKRLMAVLHQLLGSLLGVAPADGYADVPSETAAASTVQRAPSNVRIFLKGDERRAVAVRRCEIARGPVPETALAFISVDSPDGGRLEGAFSRSEDGEARLTIATRADAPSGCWRAPVCRDDGEQTGVIEIEL